MQLRSYQSFLAVNMVAHKAIRVSTVLYGSAALTAFALANGYTRTLIGLPKARHEELIVSLEMVTITAKHAHNLRSKTCRDMVLSRSDQVKIYILTEHAYEA